MSPRTRLVGTSPVTLPHRELQNKNAPEITQPCSKSHSVHEQSSRRRQENTSTLAINTEAPGRICPRPVATRREQTTTDQAEPHPPTLPCARVPLCRRLRGRPHALFLRPHLNTRGTNPKVKLADTRAEWAESGDEMCRVGGTQIREVNGGGKSEEGLFAEARGADGQCLEFVEVSEARGVSAVSP
ncbi:hypothetical protein OE88DRAFT_1642644 [Heliocybe sulcata]|uniref:Uncharacterized protein n=1 Tax=Heliocybe sulcata TaxID=5364 RepID=A0A5C3N9H2_9AGAM|nr:hypothetical protein OE88DRAFT_1642644 [Heliocybe sulcata]